MKMAGIGPAIKTQRHLQYWSSQRALASAALRTGGITRVSRLQLR
jgi:hypothetical protein